MQKELKYQENAEAFIKRQWEAYNGGVLAIYKEEFASSFDSALQDGVSPLIRDASVCAALARYGIVGLQEKILELNRDRIEAFLAKHGLPLTTNAVAELMFEDFHQKHGATTREDELYSLIFASAHEVSEKRLRRSVDLPGASGSLTYNVVFYEKPGTWSGKNSVFIIRERRIPVACDTHKTERPDFMVYMNGIPLILAEYKTEDSGLAEGLKDFEVKASYGCAPFKVAINNGRDVVFFSNIESLKLKEGRNNAFQWVHYGDKKFVGIREYSNVEYFFDELVCQPQNLYMYCMDCCSIARSGAKSYLINARIQQYFALKNIKEVLLRAQKGGISLPFNFEFAHAQRSGKTITMKLISYMIARQFSQMYQTIFIYTPDLQIKKVLKSEFDKAGYTQASVNVIETRAEYQKAASELAAGKERASFRVYIVNMQKITANDMLANLRVESTGILNIIDEAHHGQAQQLAELRDKVFTKATNFLFTATGKSEMYAYYFPDNNAAGFRNKFSISDAKECGITVPVHFLHAEKTCRLSTKLEKFSRELERRLASRHVGTASVYDVEADDLLTAIANGKVGREIRRSLESEILPKKLDYVCGFLDEIKPTLEFQPKAIVYVDSVAVAKEYISIIQKQNKNNWHAGYRFGLDVSELTADNCSTFNPGIDEPQDIEAMFQKPRANEKDKSPVIDVLLAVDKYQKGFDLPELMVTFLDTSILEPARMNQIYTRTATKRRGKQLGYCIDLSLESRNDETFQASLLLYDSKDAAECFIDESLLNSVNDALNSAFERIETTLGLTEATFTAYSILQEVLNEPNPKVRERKQEVFFTTSQKIVSALSKIGSPLYYKPFALRLKALFQAFYEFKLIYADAQHPENSKILINLDRSFTDGAYITSAEIKSVIREVLSFVEEKNLSTLLGFDYVTGSRQVITVHSEAAAQQVKMARDEERVNDLKRDFNDLGDALMHNHKPLYEHIRNLLHRIADNRALAYDKDVQCELAAVNERLIAFKAALKEQIRTSFAGNSLLYWLTTECVARFKQEQVESPAFCEYIAKSVEANLRIILPQLEEPGKTVFEKTKRAIELLLRQSVNKFASHFSNFVHAEKPALQGQLKTLADTARVNNVKSFVGDESVYEAYLQKAVTNFYQHAKG
jgi:type I site-specific restriction-modification system R (restriction) subunit